MTQTAAQLLLYTRRCPSTRRLSTLQCVPESSETHEIKGSQSTGLSTPAPAARVWLFTKQTSVVLWLTVGTNHHLGEQHLASPLRAFPCPPSGAISALCSSQSRPRRVSHKVRAATADSMHSKPQQDVKLRRILRFDSSIPPKRSAACCGSSKSQRPTARRSLVVLSFY